MVPPDGSLGIESFTKQAGFDSYFGQEQFYEDSRFGGKEEFDGTWGIWDEPFLQYFCAKLGEMKQPFIGSVFTLSSHHPFKVPEKYKDVFTDEGEFEPSQGYQIFRLCPPPFLRDGTQTGVVR